MSCPVRTHYKRVHVCVLVRDDELVTAPVLVAPVRQIPSDDDGDFSASVNTQGIMSEHRNKCFSVLTQTHDSTSCSNV